MKILLVTSEFPPGPGGIGTHAYHVAVGLSRLGWEPLVLTSQDYAPEDEIERFNAAAPFPIVRFHQVPGPPLEAIYREAVLSRWIRKHSPRILIASGSRSVLLAAARWRGRGLPWVAIGHGTEFGGDRGWEARAVRWAFGQATSVVCVSEFTRRRMREARVRARAESVICNGADQERFRTLPPERSLTLRGELGLEHARILITVGNVTRRKGQDIVVRALPSILEKAPDTHYLVVGLPSRGDEIRAMARGLGIEDRVHLLGRVEPERQVELLNAADVFVMTSRRTLAGEVEGYGIAAVEAALCGLPAVVAGGSGLAEAVSDGETGLVVPPEDPAATARAVLSLLEDEPKRRSMGERARQRAQAEQTWDRCTARYDDVLRRVCEDPSPGGQSALRGKAAL